MKTSPLLLASALIVGGSVAPAHALSSHDLSVLALGNLDGNPENAPGHKKSGEESKTRGQSSEHKGKHGDTSDLQIIRLDQSIEGGNITTFSAPQSNIPDVGATALLLGGATVVLCRFRPLPRKL